MQESAANSNLVNQASTIAGANTTFQSSQTFYRSQVTQHAKSQTHFLTGQQLLS